MAARGSALDTATLRRLAVEASVDPRTVRRRLNGEEVRGLAAHRVDAVLAQHGLKPNSEARAS